MKNKKVFFKVIAILLLLFFTAFIFSRSLKSGAESSKESETVWNIINGILKILKVDFEIGQHFIRKLAHFTEYFVLGMLAYLTSAQFLFSRKKLISFIAFIYSAVIASTDETIQFFVADRNAAITDVLIDSCGAACGIAAMVFILFLFRRFYDKKRRKNAQKPIDKH